MVKCLTVELSVNEEEIYEFIEKYKEKHDVVEIVRCKNCTHRWVHESLNKNKEDEVIECTFWDRLTDFGGFCHNGEEGEGY